MATLRKRGPRWHVQVRRNAVGKRIQAELDTLEQAAITAGWLTRDWRKQF
tara:strand:- start:780 stop:929 length:150 start_codon:yes stop_codon:yes gene_type:complete